MSVVARSEDRTTRTIAVVLTVVTAFAALLAVPAAADHYEQTTELEASSNVEAAIAWSKETFPGAGVQTALLGRDDAFPDNLASGLLQGSTSPLLLTAPEALSSPTLEELERLGVTRVTILGGGKAVSPAVAAELKEADYEVARISGPTRIETAVAVAGQRPTATNAIVARAYGGGTDETQGFADSLAAGGWAADADYPVLLTETARLSATTKSYLEDSLIQRVFIVGGTAAVSENTENEIRALGKVVQRVAGSNRFETAVAVAQARGLASAGAAGEVILSEGGTADAWASGFAGAAHSAVADAPVVLSAGAEVPSATAAFLDDGEGGTALTCGPFTTVTACSTAAEALGLRALGVSITLVADHASQGGTVDGQIRTGDRTLSNLTVSGCGVDALTVGVDDQGRFSFGIPEKAAVGTCQLTFTATFTDDSTETITKGFRVTTPGLSLTEGPEVQSVKLVGPGPNTSTGAATVVLRFTFDEELLAGKVRADRFSIYRASAERAQPSSAGLDPNDPTAVLATFPKDDYDEATTAGVATGAVQDASATFEPNPEGSVGLKTVTAAGTAAPDLVGVGDITTTSGSENTQVVFKFDADAHTVTADGYRLVRNSGEMVTCSRDVGPPAPAATSEHTVSCPHGGRAITQSDVARLAVLTGTVSDQAPPSPGQAAPGSVTNPQQSVAVTNAGVTQNPDLVSVSVNRTANTVTFAFNEEIDVATPVGSFRVYKADGSEQSSISATESGPRTVVATFPSGILDRMVRGASVDKGAVIRARTSVTDTTTVPNAIDSQAIDQVFTAGRTVAPVLVSVARETSGSGTSATVRIVYTFDVGVRIAEVAGIDFSGDFAVYEADNMRVQFPDNACSTSSQDPTKVVCSVGATTPTFENVKRAVLAVVQYDAVRDSGRTFPNHEAGAAL